MGGGAMRAAAKVAGITAPTGGIRGITSGHYSAALRAASIRPAAAAVEDVKLTASSKYEAGLQRPCSEIDDPVPRVIFGGTPTFQEAKVATSELAAALEETYISSPNSVGHEGSIVADRDASAPLSNSTVAETKACVPSETAIAPALPSPAITAFRFLHQSSAAQNVVASIACDPNVWNAMLQNQELQKFLHSQNTCLANPGTNLSVEWIEPDSDLLDKSSAKRIDDDSSDSPEPEPVGGIMNIFANIKSAVVDMMSNLSDFFQSFFGGKGAGGAFVNPDGTSKLSADTVMEASFMGLAVMAIVVILLKRV